MFMGNLAEAIDAAGIVEGPPPPSSRGLFPWWVALLVEPLRERKSADWLERLAAITVYLPLFPRQVRCFGHRHRQIMFPVMPGLLFVPTEVFDVQRRRDLFDLARVHGYLHHEDGAPRFIAKGDIEIIREIEGKLNLPPPAKGVKPSFGVGNKVRFVSELYAAMFGDGVVTDIAKDTRIGVEVEKMFGGPRTIFVPASEIERK
jgi:hypothetical protein